MENEEEDIWEGTTARVNIINKDALLAELLKSPRTTSGSTNTNLDHLLQTLEKRVLDRWFSLNRPGTLSPLTFQLPGKTAFLTHNKNTFDPDSKTYTLHMLLQIP
ncbi:hypothetical protein ACFQ4C_12095 [Larkinella insperata]|uniref:Uncharacterized protein n=1 Tax=Larkinella insperata TaxID=332158 RepID=A0ABW3QAH5_9BACT|nr:hypothetical protein [Larkinella insperata]